MLRSAGLIAEQVPLFTTDIPHSAASSMTLSVELVKLGRTHVRNTAGGLIYTARSSPLMNTVRTCQQISPSAKSLLTRLAETREFVLVSPSNRFWRSLQQDFARQAEITHSIALLPVVDVDQTHPFCLACQV